MNDPVVWLLGSIALTGWLLVILGALMTMGTYANNSLLEHIALRQPK